MLFAIAAYWGTFFLTWGTVEEKWGTVERNWWADDSDKLWLFYLAALQLNQGALAARACWELRRVMLLSCMLSSHVSSTDHR